jgi:hypothetical protein
MYPDLKNKVLTEFLQSKELKEKEKTLTPLELKYWRLMKSRTSVLYLRGPVGTAKSAIPISIAKKLGLGCYDLRLSSKDETDLGAYPKPIEVDGTHVIKHIGSDWALELNKRPSILILEELNRSRKPVLDAALQILNERTVGDIKLNENVFMIASGNLGDEDGTEVNELDAATNNRLIHVYHDLRFKDWVLGFANDNVIPEIINFIENNPKSIQTKPKVVNSVIGSAFPTFRSWTAVNNFILVNELSLTKDLHIREIETMASGTIGSEMANAFADYLIRRKSLSIKDILEDFDNRETEILSLQRGDKSRLLDDLKSLKSFWNIESDTHFDNAVKFLSVLDQDEMAGALYKLFSEGMTPALARNPSRRMIYVTKEHPILSITYKKMQMVSAQGYRS